MHLGETGCESCVRINPILLISLTIDNEQYNQKVKVLEYRHKKSYDACTITHTAHYMVGYMMRYMVGYTVG